MMKFRSLNEISREAGEEDYIVCYSEGGVPLRWGDLWDKIDTFRLEILSKNKSGKAVLFSPNRVEFLVAFLGILSEGFDLILPGALPAETAIKFEKEGFSIYKEGEILFPKSFETSQEPVLKAKEKESVIYLYTSGSTGEPQMIEKGISQFDAEVNNLSDLWGDFLENDLICGSVSHQHIYGLLFVVLLPLYRGIPFYTPFIEYPELLSGIETERLAFISSPAFIKRLLASPRKIEGEWELTSVFSSGGALAENLSRQTEEVYGVPVFEVYGSTETGGVAWRRLIETKKWTPFRGIETGLSEKGTLVLKSPYLVDNGPFETADLVEFSEDGSFELQGRADSIVKMEEKRISLKEVANRIEQHPDVAEGHAVLIDGKRQTIGVVVVLNEPGEKRKEEIGRKAFVSRLKEYMGRYFDSIFIPRKWRFVESVPCDKQGKVFKKNLTALFYPGGSDWDYSIRFLDLREKILKVRVDVRADSPYFKGHFDAFQILPGLAQVDLAMKLAVAHLGFEPKVRSIPRIKFSEPIRPGDIILCEIKGKDDMNSISFKFTSYGEGKTVSQGKMALTT